MKLKITSFRTMQRKEILKKIKIQDPWLKRIYILTPYPIAFGQC
jgi:hypothetical protein